MNRRSFILINTIPFLSILSGKAIKSMTNLNNSNGNKMPVLFIGHGNPMNAIEDNEFSRAWAKVGSHIKPKGIVCVSAHWETDGTYITAMSQPRTIHDFYGFPKKLFEQTYPAPGSPALAGEIQTDVKKTKVKPDHDWGLDHGSWSVLLKMFPDAYVPVLQLSIDRTQAPQYHYELAKELSFLRNHGILIIGSGNIVHNLRMMSYNLQEYDWAREFDEKIKKLIESGDHSPIIDYDSLGTAAKLSIPTNEHYLPLLYSLALWDRKEDIRFFNEKIDLASVSMRSLIIG